MQLYISAPTENLNKPSEELKAFAKTGLLKPGQSETIHFTLSPSDLASFDTKRTSWVADAGKYTVKIGASSADFKLTADFNLANEIIVEKDHDVLAPLVDISELNGK